MSTWGKEQAKDIRRRLGILGDDPEAVIIMAAATGTLKTWEWAKDEGKNFAEEVAEGAESLSDSQAKKDALALAKTLSIFKGVEAYQQLRERWVAAKGLSTLKGLVTFSEAFRDVYNAKLRDMAMARRLYRQPWKFMSAAGGAIKGWKHAEGLFKRFPKLAQAVDKVFGSAPGKGLLDKALVPLSFVTGLKEAVAPTHGGARGWVDRGMGLVQAGGAAGVMYGMWGGAAAAASAIPVVGWTALGIAGAYFLGSWAWDKWGDDIKAGAKQAVDWGKNKAKETLSGAKSLIEKHVSVPGPVKKLKFW
ncbi:hypothetical protein [Streptomyces sp. NPDC018031]|uniref:hypothetical protein n=1 Tax=Streptomyces sp. NPDC018031 TaxID=3365033 RepID=UPI00378A8BE1